jgi:Dolichyl-phosphate-mannose-protein mannosyltransferase
MATHCAIAANPPKQETRVRTWATYLAIALASSAYLYPFVRVLTSVPDEGIFLYGAQAVLRGAIPSRDFVEPAAPGSFFWLAAFFKLFGTNFVTARMLLLVTGVITVLLVFHLSRRMHQSGVFAAAFVLVTSIPVMVMNSPHYDSNLFALLSLAVFVSAEPAFTSRTRLFVAGLLAGVTTCFIQQKGLYVAASLVVALMLLHKKHRLPLIGILCAGYSCVVAAGVALYAGLKALPDLVYVNFVWPLSMYESVNAASYGYTLRESWWPTWFAGLRPHFPLSLTLAQIVIFSVPWVLILAVPFLLPIFAYVWRRDAFRRDMLPYWLAGYALWASELHRLDLGHLRNGIPILMILFFAVCEKQQEKIPRRLAFGSIACLTVYATVNLLGAAASDTAIHSRRGTLRASSSDAALEFLISHTRPGEDVFVYPYRPIYYFLADVRNPTRFSYLIYRLNTPAQFREATHDLESKKVRYVLWDRLARQNLTALFPAYREPPADQLIMEPYLEARYRQIGSEGEFRILERRESE